ncbi:MAG: FAD-dependent oxidoreductase, partial [Candidatus Cloacimonetes bacterium]|nr:FAD-dependent oxidoreductase [Candidatus Cloacimonadota bacterium]
MNNYDVVIIGAGSIGVPAALTLTEKKLKVLVIELKTSPGQENNKKAIGGIRATHSDYGKIRISLSSIDIFRTWKEKYSDDIGWIAGGYSFPAYSAEDEKNLKDLMEIQHSFGLNIEWVSAQEYNELVPGINMKDLRGSTYSPDDGSASPLLALNAFYFKSLEYGAEYKFREKVINIKRSGNSSFEIITGKTKYSAKYIINAAGNYAR